MQVIVEQFYLEASVDEIIKIQHLISQQSLPWLGRFFEHYGAKVNKSSVITLDTALPLDTIEEAMQERYDRQGPTCWQEACYQVQPAYFQPRADR